MLFADILPFFKDERYIKIDEKPVLLIYNLKLFEKQRALQFIQRLKNLAQKEGFAGLYIIGVKSFAFEKQLEFGADVQVRGHIQGNLNIGYDRAFLIEVLTALIPYIGYPRTLNALNALDELTLKKRNCPLCLTKGGCWICTKGKKDFS